MMKKNILLACFLLITFVISFLFFASRSINGIGGKIRQVNSNLKMIETSLKLYQQEYDLYPPNLKLLLIHQKKSPEPYLHGGKDLLKDSWGTPYNYELKDGIFKLTSYGKDKKPGGKNFAKDIVITNGITKNN